MRGMKSKKRQNTASKVEIRKETPTKSKKPRAAPTRQDSGPKRVKVTTLRPWDRVFVGNRWYVVQKVRIIGARRGRHSFCIVKTLEKGGMHFRANSKVLRSPCEEEE